jgi:hypothetical protein
MANEKVGKEKLKNILESDYEEVISSLKEDYEKHISK